MGGVAIILVLIVLVALAVLGFFLFGTGGFLWKRKTDPREDRAEGGMQGDADETGRGRRPRHTRPTSPAQEHTDFVGTSNVPDETTGGR